VEAEKEVIATAALVGTANEEELSGTVMK